MRDARKLALITSLFKENTTVWFYMKGSTGYWRLTSRKVIGVSRPVFWGIE